MRWTDMEIAGLRAENDALKARIKDLQAELNRHAHKLSQVVPCGCQTSIRLEARR